MDHRCRRSDKSPSFYHLSCRQQRQQLHCVFATQSFPFFAFVLALKNARTSVLFLCARIFKALEVLLGTAEFFPFLRKTVSADATAPEDSRTLKDRMTLMSLRDCATHQTYIRPAAKQNSHRLAIKSLHTPNGPLQPLMPKPIENCSRRASPLHRPPRQ